MVISYCLLCSQFSPLKVLSRSVYLMLSTLSSADDAIIKYEGITIRRPTNTIDDVVPEVTLNVFDKTEKTATIAVKPDVESAKEALITFVGKYNQSLAEINILSQNKPEIVEELDYLSSDEKKKSRKNSECSALTLPLPV